MEALLAAKAAEWPRTEADRVADHGVRDLALTNRRRRADALRYRSWAEGRGFGGGASRPAGGVGGDP